MDYSVDVSSQEIHLSDLQNGCPAIHFSPLHGRLSLGSVHQPQGEVATFSKGDFTFPLRSLPHPTPPQILRCGA